MTKKIKPHEDSPAQLDEPELTPEVVKRLAQESSELGEAMRRRIEKMWEIDWRERKVPCR